MYNICLKEEIIPVAYRDTLKDDFESMVAIICIGSCMASNNSRRVAFM